MFPNLNHNEIPGLSRIKLNFRDFPGNSLKNSRALSFNFHDFSGLNSFSSKGAHRIFFQGRAMSGGRGQWLGGTMASAEHEPITGVWGQSPWSGGQGGEAPLKLKAFWSLDVQRSRQI